MTEAEHRQRHKELHKSFDELLADYLIQHHGALPTNIDFVEFLTWAYEQTINPTVPMEGYEIRPLEVHDAKPN